MALTQISTGMLASGDGTVDLNIDNGTFVVDVSTSRVGIGTGSPASLIDATGAPQATSGSIVRVRNTSATSSNTSFGGVLFTSSPGTDFSIGKSNVNAATSLSFRNGNTGASLMELTDAGNVGIGVVPENSSGTWRNLQFGGGNLAFRSSGNNDAMIGTGYVFKTDNSEVYKNTEAASRLFFDNSSMIFQQAASGSAGTAISWSESMRIDASGNVGIGTGTASLGGGRRLTVAGGAIGVSGQNTSHSASSMVLGQDSTAISQIRFYGANTSTAGILQFTGSSSDGSVGDERMRIDASGNLLVGGTSLNAASSVGFTAAGQIRQVFASGVANDSLFGAISGVSNGFQIIQDTSNNQSYKFHNGGTPSLTIDSSGRMLVGTSSAIGGAGGSGAQLFVKQSSVSNGISSVANSNDHYVRMLHTGTIGKIESTYGTGSYTPLTLFTSGAERVRIAADGIVVHNGVSTYSNGLVMTNNVTYIFDIPVGNEGGSGNVIEVHAMYDHFYNFGYGASLITLVGKRGVSVNRSDIKSITTGNGGAWTVSAPNATTLRLTKSAGTYSGTGFGHIMVRFRKS